ncbi:MAG TPA: PHP domain-containing protein [Nocardioidaceae bacterium]|nr:PHP domain-containing protein [Nocardioidaceae bacterium]
MRIDLHTHSDRSDGTLSPAELVHAAVDARLDVLALTDHDCFEGWDDAAVAATELGLTLVRGIEISCRYAGQSVHLLGYLPDPTYQPLLDELGLVLDGRNARLPAIIARLHDLGIDLAIEDVERVATDAAAMGRPHVADALVERGVVRDRDEAFARLLSPGRPAYVDRYAADLVRMIELVKAAGGVTVVAHPWGRYDHSALSAEGLAALKEAGLSGVEVDHQDHDADVREALRGLAKELDLVTTGSSDFHGAGKVDHELGCNTTAPDELERLLTLAREAASASGRTTPEVVS